MGRGKPHLADPFGENSRRSPGAGKDLARVGAPGAARARRRHRSRSEARRPGSRRLDQRAEERRAADDSAAASPDSFFAKEVLSGSFIEVKSQKERNMIVKHAGAFLFVMLLASGLRAQEGPNRPEAKPLTLDSKTTAVLVLDLSSR